MFSKLGSVSFSQDTFFLIMESNQLPPISAENSPVVTTIVHPAESVIVQKNDSIPIVETGSSDVLSQSSTSSNELRSRNVRSSIQNENNNANADDDASNPFDDVQRKRETLTNPYYSWSHVPGAFSQNKAQQQRNVWRRSVDKCKVWYSSVFKPRIQKLIEHTLLPRVLLFWSWIQHEIVSGKDSAYGQSKRFKQLALQTKTLLKKALVALAVIVGVYLLFWINRTFISTSHWYSIEETVKLKEWQRTTVDLNNIEKLYFSDWESFYGEQPFCYSLSSDEETLSENDQKIIQDKRASHFLSHDDYLLYDNETTSVFITLKEIHQSLLTFATRNSLEFATLRMFVNLTMNYSRPPCVCLIQNMKGQFEFMINPVVANTNARSSSTSDKKKIMYSSQIIHSDRKSTLVPIPETLTIYYKTYEQFLKRENGHAVQKTYVDQDAAIVHYCLKYMSRQ